eukprot:GFYU01011825.1.p1 GENE.GFYU01011825.1~~GFYU01011825.1.p1  ORF type:complete len:212 (-),score=53.84 GFYU01011825.1:105-740(-)
MYTVGLTGGIACGKSTVCDLLQQNGATIVDADKLGHRAYERGTGAYHKLIETFGEDILLEDKSINRKALGGKVFGNPDNMKKLCDITWPAIKSLALEEFKKVEAAGGKSLVVLEAAILLEAGWNDIVDEVWIVGAKPELMKERLMARNQFSEEEAMKRIQSQKTLEERIEMGNPKAVLTNNTSSDDLKRQVTEQLTRLQKEGKMETVLSQL